MKVLVLVLALMGLPLGTLAYASNCEGPDHIHSDEKMKDKKIGI